MFARVLLALVFAAAWSSAFALDCSSGARYAANGYSQNGDFPDIAQACASVGIGSSVIGHFCMGEEVGGYVTPVYDLCSPLDSQVKADAAGSGSGSVPDIFNISPDGGALLASAILACWAAAWAFRMLIRTLSIDGNPPTSESDT
jgi:preprotein translocase subunit SecF